jgi:hypothetical protein
MDPFLTCITLIPLERTISFYHRTRAGYPGLLYRSLDSDWCTSARYTLPLVSKGILMSSRVGIGKLVDGDGKYVLWHFTGVRGYSDGLGSRVIAGVLMDFFEGRLWIFLISFLGFGA